MKDEEQQTYQDEQRPAGDASDAKGGNARKSEARDETGSTTSDQAQREQDRALETGDENPT